MAGIKNVYRSPDAFRFPTYDRAMSYSVNSVVAFYDSETTRWNYYIAKDQTASGSLEYTTTRHEQWTQFSFDSDTFRDYALLAVNQNFNALTNAIATRFSIELARLDSENDSDFLVLKLKLDSDIAVWRDRVDSENNAFKSNVDSDVLSYTRLFQTQIDDNDSDILRLQLETIKRTYPGLLTQRVTSVVFTNTTSLSAVDPHNDTIAYVKSNNSLYFAIDSEWYVVSDRNVRVAAENVTQLNAAWPHTGFTVGTRALTTDNEWIYSATATGWEVIPESQKDTQYTSAINTLTTKTNALDAQIDSDLSSYKVDLKALKDKNIDQDGKILQNTTSYVSLYNRLNDYEDIIDAKITQNTDTIDTANTNIINLQTAVLTATTNLSDSNTAWQTSTLNTLNTGITNQNVVIRDAVEHFEVSADSDRLYLMQTVQPLTTTIDNLTATTSAWRTNEVNRFDALDTTIATLQSDVDSDRLADNQKFYGLSMKYRGDVYIDSEQYYPTFEEVGDVYTVPRTGVGLPMWGAQLSGTTVRANSMILYTAEKGWVVMNSGASGGVFETPIAIDNIGVPAGTILTFPNSESVPTSFRITDGATYNTAVYIELYNLLGVNTLPNIAGSGVVYAIAMYSGAGGTKYEYDSDLRRTVTEHDSDINFFYMLRRDFDSDIARNKHDTEKRDSDIIEMIKLRDSENDSDFIALRIRVDNLGASTKLVQWSTLYNVAAVGGIVSGTEYDITAEVINTSVPEAYCYPDLEFFFDSQSANAHPTLNGRRLDGQNGTPQVTYRIIHDNVGGMTIGLSSSAAISNDIRIVSTFRIA